MSPIILPEDEGDAVGTFGDGTLIEGRVDHEGMTFRQIVDLVLKDAFDESRRGDAKQWVNHRYWWVWTLEEWTFRYRSTFLPAVADEPVPENLGPILAFIAPDGSRLTYLAPREFFQLYPSGEMGTPAHYTLVGSAVVLGPAASNESDLYRIVDEQDFTPLGEDKSTPMLPVGAHMGLVLGARAEGLKLQHNPLWQAIEADFLATIDVLRHNYLAVQRGDSGQVPAYRP